MIFVDSHHKPNNKSKCRVYPQNLSVCINPLGARLCAVLYLLSLSLPFAINQPSAHASAKIKYIVFTRPYILFDIVYIFMFEQFLKCEVTVLEPAAVRTCVDSLGSLRLTLILFCVSFFFCQNAPLLIPVHACSFFSFPACLCAPLHVRMLACVFTHVQVCIYVHTYLVHVRAYLKCI